MKRSRNSSVIARTQVSIVETLNELHGDNQIKEAHYVLYKR